MTQNQDTGLKMNYGKWAIVFAIVVAIVGVLSIAAASTRATVMVGLKSKIENKSEEWKVTVDKEIKIDPSTMDFAVLSEEISDSGQFSPREGEEKDGYARGTVTLINNSGNNQTLVATTRLLTEEGVLFRIEKQVVIPAGGKITTTAKADKSGATGNVEAGKFSIPGLSESLQEKIYAETDKPMTGGVVKVGILTQDDFDKSVESLKKDLREAAIEKIKAKTGEEKYKDYQMIEELVADEIENQSSSVKIGDETGGFTLEIKMRFTAFLPKIAAVKNLIGGNETETENIGEMEKMVGAEWKVEKTETGGKVSLSWNKIEEGSSLPEIDTRQMTFKTYDGVKKYLAEQDLEVENLEIKFSPSWIKLTPITAKHITLELK